MKTSSFISADLTSTLRQLAPEAERAGQLHAGQLSIIYEQKWFNLYVPKENGGLALSLPEGLEIEEGLAWVDGSVGWTVTLCSGANWFVGFLNPEITEILFSNPKVCLAGSGRPSGIARRRGEGYRITGSWSYATGAPHATAFTANCIIEEEGSVVKNPDGTPLVRAFLFLKEEVSLDQNWRVIGLAATASYRFHVDELEVGEDRSFIIDANAAILPGAVFQYPFLPFAEATLAVNSSGMAARFIELAGAENVLSNPKEKETAIRSKELAWTSRSQQVRHAKKELERLRQEFYKAVRTSWYAHIDPAADKESRRVEMLLEEVSRTSRNLARGARSLVDELYPFCGLLAADPTTEINRVWRNLHTASQHTLLLENSTG